MNIFDFGIGLSLYEKANKETGAFTSIESSLEFRHHSFTTELDEYFPAALYGINNTFVGFKSLNSKWFMVGILSSGIFSDFKNVDGDHFLFEGGVLFAKKISKNLTLGIGPIVTYAFGNPLIIPAPLVKYTSRNEKITLDVKVPQHVVLGYAFSKNFKTALAARSLYSNYSLGDDKAVNQDGKSPTVVFSDLTLALESTIRLFGPVGLDVALGTTLKRTFTVDDNKGDELFDRNLENTFFVSAGLKAPF